MGNDGGQQEGGSHKAAELSFDLSKQFLSISFAGVGFAIGVSTAEGQARGTWLFWAAVILFGLSALLGFLFMMRGASDFCGRGSFDIYEKWARVLAGAQIALVFVGVIVLLFLHLNARGSTTGRTDGVRVEHGGNVISAPSDVSVEIKIARDGAIDVLQGSDLLRSRKIREEEEEE